MSSEHVEVLWAMLRKCVYERLARKSADREAAALAAAIASLSAPQPPAEAQPVALDYVPVKRSDLLRWAEDFVRDNDPGDDTDVVTPFDDYLLQPFADEFSHDLRALAQQPAAVDGPLECDCGPEGSYSCPVCGSAFPSNSRQPAAVECDCPIGQVEHASWCAISKAQDAQQGGAK